MRFAHFGYLFKKKKIYLKTKYIKESSSSSVHSVKELLKAVETVHLQEPENGRQYPSIERISFWPLEEKGRFQP